MRKKQKSKPSLSLCLFTSLCVNLWTLPLDSWWGHDEDRNYLRERGYKNGEKIRAVLTKPRNEKFNRLVHGMGHLIVTNIEGYEGLTSHEAIKRLQVEGRIYCNIEILTFDKIDFQHYIPRSISYDSMDEHAFQDFWLHCCKYLIDRYWPEMDEDDITQMIEFQSFSYL